MFEPLNSLAIGLAELALAFAVFHRAMPAAQEYGRARALKFWLLGFALGLFGMGRLFFPPASAASAAALVYSFGHYCLIAYAACRLRHIARHSGARWGNHL